MAIRLRQSTQKDQQASAASFGLGLDQGDGGARAIQGALGQVAGATKQIAGNLERKREALSNQGIADAQNTYATAVADASARAKDASIDEDIDRYNAAMEDMEKLKGAPLNAFIPARDRDIQITEDKWQSAQLVADRAYGIARNSLDIATTTTQYAAKFSRKAKEVGAASSLLISEGNVGPGGIMETDARSNALATGELTQGATPKAMEALELEMTRYANDSISAFAASKDKYTSVARFNEDVDIIKDIYSKGDAYGRHKGMLMKKVEALRIKETSGTVSLPTATTSQIADFKTTSGKALHIIETDIDSMQAHVNEYGSKNLDKSSRALIDSLKQVIPVYDILQDPQIRQDMQNWKKENPTNTSQDYLDTYDKGILDTALPEDKKAVLAHMDSIFSTYTEPSPEAALDVNAGEQQFNTTATVKALSAFNAKHIESAEVALNNAFDTYDLDDPAAAMPFIQAAVEGYTPVTGTDYDKKEFVGLTKATEYLKAHPMDGRAFVATVGSMSSVWGPERTAQFVASNISGKDSHEQNLLTAGLRYNAIFAEDGDVDDLTNISAGMDEAAWMSSAEGKGMLDQYNLWKTYAASEDSQVSQIVADMKSADPADAYWMDNYIKGFAIQQHKDSRGQVSPEKIDELLANQLNDRFQFHEAYGNVSVQIRSKMADGSWSNPVMSWIKRVPGRLSVIGDKFNPFTEGEGAYQFGDYAQGLGGTSLTESEYAHGQVNEAVFQLIDSGNLQYNLQRFSEDGGSIDAKIDRLSNPADRLLDMMEDGKVRLSNSITKGGTGAKVLEIYVEKKLDPKGIYQNVWAGGDVYKDGWETLVDENNKPYLIAEQGLDVNFTEYRKTEDRLDASRWKRRGKSAAVFLGAGAARLNEKPRGKHELTPFGESVKDFFSDLF